MVLRANTPHYTIVEFWLLFQQIYWAYFLVPRQGGGMDQDLGEYTTCH